MSGEEKKRKPGRPPGPPLGRYAVTLDPKLAEWAKRQPEGLSGLIRQLLLQEMKKR